MMPGFIEIAKIIPHAIKTPIRYVSVFTDFAPKATKE
jgi:hypothetical protein